MIEGFAREMPEDLMIEAILTAFGYVQQICQLQEDLAAQVQPVKQVVPPPPSDQLYERLKQSYYADFREAKRTEGKQARAEAVKALKQKALAEVIPDPDAEGAVCEEAFCRGSGTSWRRSWSAT